jgi:hypothetical protein
MWPNYSTMEKITLAQFFIVKEIIIVELTVIISL